jgi:hypothetical protein
VISLVSSEIKLLDVVVHICNPSPGRLRQKNYMSEASLGCIVRPCLKKQETKTKKAQIQEYFALIWQTHSSISFTKGAGLLLTLFHFQFHFLWLFFFYLVLTFKEHKE